MPQAPFNPLDKRHLGESLAAALLKQPVGPLPPSRSFDGAGIYAIYYTGPFPAYAPIAKKNAADRYAQPIYVGKAVPPGARKGGFGLDTAPSSALAKRLAEHAKSITEAQNLNLADFTCRYLVADDIWIPLGESLLIEQFQPLWNVLVDGFGNHPPGGNRPQTNSLWDTLHPGRPWAARLLSNQRAAGEILALVNGFLEGRVGPAMAINKAVLEEG
jgi:hypothetical protein